MARAVGGGWAAAGREESGCGVRTGDRDGLDAVGLELLLKICTGKGIEALLAYNDDVAGLRRHRVDNLGVPRARSE